MAGGASAVFSQKPLVNWLLEKNPTDVLMKQATTNLLHSLAGYCIATYGKQLSLLLGISNLT